MTNAIDQVKLQNMFPKTIGLFFGDWKLKREVIDHTKSNQKMIQTQKMMHMKCMYLCIVDSKTHYAKHERKQWGGK
jgi:hypothetical protein